MLYLTVLIYCVPAQNKGLKYFVFKFRIYSYFINHFDQLLHKKSILIFYNRLQAFELVFIPQI